jgi:hypothetical protein
MDFVSQFEFHPEADVVLRSSDNVHLYVVGSLLRHVSPFFMDMLTNPAIEQTEKRDGRPVIPLEEDGRTLRLLLDFLHPNSEEPPLTDATSFWNVAKATQKYRIAVVERKLKDRIVTSDLMSADPFSPSPIQTKKRNLLLELSMPLHSFLAPPNRASQSMYVYPIHSISHYVPRQSSLGLMRPAQLLHGLPRLP